MASLLYTGVSIGQPVHDIAKKKKNKGRDLDKLEQNQKLKKVQSAVNTLQHQGSEGEMATGHAKEVKAKRQA